MNKSLIATVSVMFFLAASVFASPTGREIADMGKSISVSGILSEEDGEWYIAQGAVTYAIHLGNYEIIYPDGLGLKAGSRADVQGFVSETDVTVLSIKVGAKEYVLRSKDGTPLWAGRGQGKNRTTEGSAGEDDRS